jgi:murein L,D-transpeptidase YcbB/YkuD
MTMVGPGMMMTAVALLAFFSAFLLPSPEQRNPAHWTGSDVQQLLEVASSVESEGLDRADYPVASLEAAVRAGDDLATDRAASALFLRLAHDFSQGHVEPSGRMAWHIENPSRAEALQQLLTAALASDQVARSLRALLPQSAEYKALKQALASTPASDRAAVLRLRANLERWRWMPRKLGQRYLLVNVPAFEVRLVDGGKVIGRHKIVVGKVSRPTPQFEALVQGVVLNPWWDIPPRIAAEGIGRQVRRNPAAMRARGYVLEKGRFRQRPGPTNALGQIKLVMPNPYNVYLHDTPSKELFDQHDRTFSHGCIRTEDAVGLGVSLLDNRSWSREAINQEIGKGATRTIPLATGVPVYVTYFTADVDVRGGVASYPDVYKRDSAVIAQLVPGIRNVPSKPN